MLKNIFKGNSNSKLTLADYKDIWTPFCFLDESGTLDVKSQPYFTVGMIKCSQPYFLQQKIRYIRESNNFWWEFKFQHLSQTKIKTTLSVLDALLSKLE